MTRRIAIIGAGVSGLAAAKASLERGLEPTIFETAANLGGLWRREDGFVWEDMRTNLSKWTCAFSDHPWPEAADEFPLGSDVEVYLQSYATKFDLGRLISFNQTVTALEPRSGHWKVSTTTGAPQEFGAVVVATGIFARPFVPQVPGLADFRGTTSHGATYRSAGKRQGRIAVIGGSLSGIEIASHLADNKIDVVLVFGKPCWILPRYVSHERKRQVPLDLLLYRRKEASPQDRSATLEEKYRETAAFFEETFGNPGSVHPALRTMVDGTPPYVAISDTFLAHVASGAIAPVKERLEAMNARGIRTASGKDIAVEEIIFCTGYETDMSCVPAAIRSAIEYDSSDKLVPYIADKTVVHPAAAGLYFVGMYRGPYFGIIELQARWASMMAAGDIAPPRDADSAAGLDRERAIRQLRPRPQFPHGDYVNFADAIAAQINALPAIPSDGALAEAIKRGPVTPAQFRLNGPDASPAVAIPSILSASQRIEA